MRSETKVGLLFIATLALIAAFAYYLDAFNPFSNTKDLWVAYNFAGGIEVGSPVRVMGIKVGKVKEIIFDPNLKTEAGEEVKLKIRIGVEKRAWSIIRSDSEFYINLAGVIGEKFVEITPGKAASEKLRPGTIVRGIDPPRIDQLISQSYGLAGKILDVINKNEGSITDTLKMADHLVANLNSLLNRIDKMSKNDDANKIFKNLVSITEDMAYLTKALRDPKSEKTFQLLQKLIWRLEGLDDKALKKFFQEEGIKAKLF
ncbi:MAG: organic solvent ABC transporter substrate-binding protein [Proteobacteria bacterium SG_bin7]|nr:MAG: organic solvent ABC transporter substrate-binding protein [Proteobacteria bacterium SG_bin7]